MNADEIVARLVRRQFGQPLIQNDLRGQIVEEIVAAALGDGWSQCGGNWGACDLEHSSKIRMQVKQSAARQSWEPPVKVREPRFSIAYKTGRWDGAKWTSERSRNAEIFCFAFHPGVDENADHRDPYQWAFYCVPETLLPAANSIGLTAVRRLVAETNFDGLSNVVSRLVALVSRA